MDLRQVFRFLLHPLQGTKMFKEGVKSSVFFSKSLLKRIFRTKAKSVIRKSTDMAIRGAITKQIMTRSPNQSI
jgi:hypothetical protein